MHVLQRRFVGAEGAEIDHAGVEVLHDVGRDPVVLLVHHLTYGNGRKGEADGISSMSSG